MNKVNLNSSKPIFLFGYPRSGTSWLTLSLRDYLGVGMVNEGTFISKFGKKYLADDRSINFYKLKNRIEHDEFTRILKQAYDITLDWPSILDKSRGGTYSDFIRLVFADISTKLGSRYIGSKSPAFGTEFSVLLRHFPNALFIHIIRDGRDCALSHYQKRWGRTNAYVAAAAWREYIARVQTQLVISNPDYIEVYYEDLLSDPTCTFKRLADFVHQSDTKPADSMYGRQPSECFGASVKPEDYKNQAFKWKNKMTARDVDLYNRTAGKKLRELGYSVDTINGAVPIWRRAYYQFMDRSIREWRHFRGKISQAVN